MATLISVCQGHGAVSTVRAESLLSEHLPGLQRLCTLKRGLGLCNVPSTFPLQLNRKCMHTYSSLNFLLNSLNRPISTQRICGMCWLVPWSYGWGIPGIWRAIVTKENGPAFLQFDSLLRKFYFFSRAWKFWKERNFVCGVFFSMKYTLNYKVIVKLVKCLIKKCYKYMWTFLF